MDHEIDDARQEPLELQSDGDDCILCPGEYCTCCGQCSVEDDGQPTEYEEWQDLFGGDEDPPTDIDDMTDL